MALLASALDTVNAVVDSRAVLGALLVAALSAAAGYFWRRRHQARDITWSVLYDERINQGQSVDDDPGSRQNLWEIRAQGQRIDDGSLVLLKVRHTGTEAVETAHWDRELTFTFRNREVMGFKVRDHDGLHNAMAGHQPSGGPELKVPKFLFNRDADFKLLVLLKGRGEEIKASGDIVAGRILRHDKLPRPYRLIAAVASAAVLVVGVTAGVQMANTALTPSARCASGSLTLYGSTAFAPIANQVRNSYRQLCGDGATITITADGSEQGLAELANNTGSPALAMSDGLATSARTARGLTPHGVGVVTYALVANTALASRLPDLFSGSGVSADELGRLFSAKGDPEAQGVVAVGRTDASGTRSAFAHAFFRDLDPEPAHAAACPQAGPQAGPSPHAFCVADSTMALLSYVDSHPDAIGYAEADALPYFPDVQVLAVDGQKPGADAVKSGAYPFAAPEYLYAAQPPTGLTADFEQFLDSEAVAATLRGHGFIPCADLTGTRFEGNCSG